MTQQEKERIQLLDLARGLAVLGILLMNIRIFSEPYTAYFNPQVYSDYTGLNATWWNFQFIVADQKFMAIFAMLFGASTAIICDGLAKRGEAVGRIYAKRIFGLLVIGVIHAYLLWPGDVLVIYAMVSILPFLFRNVSWKKTAATGVGILAFGCLWGFAGNQMLSQAPTEYIANMVAETWLPPDAALAAEVAAFQGSWMEHFPYRQSTAWHFHTDIFLNWGMWRAGGLMLVGLALYRQGFLRGTLSARTYRNWVLLALPIGFFLTYTGLKDSQAADWQFPYTLLVATIWNYWGSLLIAIGYMSIFGYLLKATNFRFGFKAITNIGRAALSNYIFQTLACITVFYGFGGGLFGKLERAETAIVVIAVWAAQLLLSAWWLKRHEKGPLEAIWHRATYANWLGRSETAETK